MSYFDIYLNKLKSSKKVDVVHVRTSESVVQPMYRVFTDWLTHLAKTSLAIPVAATTLIAPAHASYNDFIVGMAKQDPVLSVYVENAFEPSKAMSLSGAIFSPSAHCAVLNVAAERSLYTIAPKGALPHVMSASASLNPNVASLIGKASDRVFASAYRDFYMVTHFGRHASKSEFDQFMTHFERYTVVNKQTAMAFRLAVDHARSGASKKVDEKNLALAAVDAAAGSTLLWMISAGVDRKDAINVTDFGQSVATNLVNMEHDMSMAGATPPRRMKT